MTTDELRVLVANLRAQAETRSDMCGEPTSEYEEWRAADAITALLDQLAAAERDAARKGQQLDHLLSHCRDSECMTCGTIICEHGEPLHFHHDGCPACVFAEMEKEQADAAIAAQGKS